MNLPLATSVSSALSDLQLQKHKTIATVPFGDKPTAWLLFQTWHDALSTQGRAITTCSINYKPYPTEDRWKPFLLFF